jgi:hypothetical protein
MFVDRVCRCGRGYSCDCIHNHAQNGHVRPQLAQRCTSRDRQGCTEQMNANHSLVSRSGTHSVSDRHLSWVSHAVHGRAQDRLPLCILHACNGPCMAFDIPQINSALPANSTTCAYTATCTPDMQRESAETPRRGRCVVLREAQRLETVVGGWGGWVGDRGDRGDRAFKSNGIK